VLDVQWFDGHEWDFVFDVDVSDNAPPLKMPMNRGEDPYDVADRFMAKHMLPASYREQIVRFILENSQGLTAGAPLADAPGMAIWHDRARQRVVWIWSPCTSAPVSAVNVVLGSKTMDSLCMQLRWRWAWLID
jgi:PFU (PLAA family ubiquitin binding)